MQRIKNTNFFAQREFPPAQILIDKERFALVESEQSGKSLWNFYYIVFHFLHGAVNSWNQLKHQERTYRGAICKAPSWQHEPHTWRIRNVLKIAKLCLANSRMQEGTGRVGLSLSICCLLCSVLSELKKRKHDKQKKKKNRRKRVEVLTVNKAHNTLT